MAAVSVVDLQYAEIDFGLDIFEVDGIRKIVMDPTIHWKKKTK